MPSEYGDKQSISVYIEKNYVKKIDTIANTSGKTRSSIIAELVKQFCIRS